MRKAHSVYQRHLKNSPFTSCRVSFISDIPSSLCADQGPLTRSHKRTRSHTVLGDDALPHCICLFSYHLGNSLASQLHVSMGYVIQWPFCMKHARGQTAHAVLPSHLKKFTKRLPLHHSTSMIKKCEPMVALLIII